MSTDICHSKSCIAPKFHLRRPKDGGNDEPRCGKTGFRGLPEMFARIGFSIAALCATVAVVHAAPITIDFSLTGSNYTASKTFVQDDVTVTATGHTRNSNGTLDDVASNNSSYGIRQWSGNGLGIENSTSDNSHTIDGSGLSDYLLLTFDTPVQIVGATFSYVAQLSGSINSFSLYADGDGDVSGDRLLANSTISSNSINIAALLDNTAFEGLYSTAWAFGAGIVCARYDAGQCTRTKFESYKLKSITFDLAPPQSAPGEVPVPAALPLLASGLGLLGYVGWRRRRNA